MNDFISASHDVAFKALFVRNPDILKAFLNDSLDLNLTDDDALKIMSSEDIPNSADGKLSRFDVHVRTAKRRYNIEMQASRNGFGWRRVMYYWGRLYIGDFKSGDRYEDLEQTYSVNVLGFSCLKNENYHSEFAILEKNCLESPTDVLSIHVFELPKVPAELLRDDRAQDWMRIIKADSEEKLESIRTRTEDPMIKKAIDAICDLNADERLREQIRVQEKALLDYGSGIADAEARGETRGIAIGEARGRAEGEAKAYFGVIENMRRNGFSEEQIKLVVGEGYKG
ncbi:MAG: Rpn family recombination-promoting nuclease/putative transposase [Thermoguttaceae bacterium]|nr:Rpn family recombination-promoting nuclease/putative transposase [Thermoguttaceae bacterium]